MELKNEDRHTPAPDGVAMQQEAYAFWLNAGARLGLALLAITFIAYVSGLAEPQVPIEKLPSLWALSAEEFRNATGGPLGWEWVALLGRGDYLTYLGIAVLGFASLTCFLRVAPALAARGERLYAAIAFAQIVVLALAASGMLSGGH
jgi:hypothetical protein